MPFVLIGEPDDSIRFHLDANRAQQLEEAVRNVELHLAIEEKYNMVLENYEEWERDLLSAALSRSIFESDKWIDHMSQLSRFTRRLANLLSTGRLYVDQIRRHDLTALFGEKSETESAFTQALEREKTRSLGFRSINEIRNHVQHGGLPAHSITLQMTRRGVRRLLEYRVSIQVRPDAVRDGDPRMIQVMEELRALGESVELPPLVREYMTGLARMHDELRANLDTSKSHWDNVVLAALEVFQSENREATNDPVLVEIADDGSANHRVQLSRLLIDRRRWLESRSRHARAYEQTLISNQSPE
jgi:hypothetical protein